MAKGFIKGALWGSCVSLSAVVLVSVFSGGVPQQPGSATSTEGGADQTASPADEPVVAEVETAREAPATAADTTSETASNGGTTLPVAGAPDTLDGLRESDMTPAAVPETGAATALLQPEASSTTGTTPDAPQVDAAVPGAGQTAGLTVPTTETAATVSTSPAAQPVKTPAAGRETAASAPAPSVQTEVAALAPPTGPEVPQSAPAPDEGSISNLPLQPPAPDLPSERGAFTEAAPDTIAAADPAQPQAPAVLVSGTAFEDSARPAGDAVAPEVATVSAMAPAETQPAGDTSDGTAAYASTDTAPAEVPAAQVAVSDTPESAPAAPSAAATSPAPEVTQPEVQAAVRQPEPVTRDVAAGIADTSSQSAPSAEAPAQAGTAPDAGDQVTAPQDNTPAPVAEPAPLVVAQNSLEGSFADRTDEVPVNRLPSLGDDEDPAAEAPEATDAAPADAAPVAGGPPLEQYAETVENPDGKPVMAIVLMDDGVDLSAATIGLPALRSFPHPVTFAVEATLPDAASRAEAYRNEGFEVLAMINLPDGAGATDAEVSVAAALAAVPEAVGVLEGAGTGVQTTTDAARQVSEILSASGHGFVTQNRGLNTVQKLAARAGVPSAIVFRDFDSQGQSPVVIRRFLDQAAFRAGQEDGVVMLGRLREDTISALLVWALQDRADRVAIVPVSGALSETE